MKNGKYCLKKKKRFKWLPLFSPDSPRDLSNPILD